MASRLPSLSTWIVALIHFCYGHRLMLDERGMVMDFEDINVRIWETVNSYAEYGA